MFSRELLKKEKGLKNSLDVIEDKAKMKLSKDKNTVLVGSPDAASAVSNLPPLVVPSL